MEYLIGAIVMLVALNLVRKYVDVKVAKYNVRKPMVSQSRAFSTVRMHSMFVMAYKPKELKTQATAHFDKTHLKVAIDGDKAYWVFNNTLFEANYVNGDIDRNSTKTVDTMAMDKVQLDKMFSIVEQLGGGYNDSGSTGNS